MSAHGRPRRSRRGPLLIVAFMVAVVVVVAVLVVHAVSGAFGTPDYSGDGYGSVTVHVVSGDTETAIGQILLADHVVASVKAFTDVAASDSRAADIQPGYYRLHEHMSGASALALLLSPSSVQQETVVIPEGLTEAAIVDRIVADTTITRPAIERALADPSSIGLPAFAHGKAEGLLYPATYDFPPGTTATAALSEMVARFKQEADQLGLARRAHRVGLTEYQAVILASIIEHEYRLPQYLPKIAEVFLNRVAQHRPLGSNATLAYVFGHPPTASELQSSSPYNTEFDPGFPPTPIGSPGQATLDAVLHPAHGDLLYFVTVDSAGHVAFASTDAGFAKISAEAHANGQD